MPPPDDSTAVYADVVLSGDVLLLTLAGTLNGGTYRTVRDAVVKAAVEQPAMLVVDVSGLHVPVPTAWSVFTSARWLIKDWPEVPFALVCAHSSGRRALTRNGVSRYVAVYGEVDVAVAALTSYPHPLRRRVRQWWSADRTAVRAAQQFVSDWLVDWSMREYVLTARVVATVLVENVVRHTASAPDLRLENNGDTVVVAVADDSRAVATIHEDVGSYGALTELNIVQAMTRLWGNTPTPSGKVVWGVIGPENCL